MNLKCKFLFIIRTKGCTEDWNLIFSIYIFYVCNQYQIIIGMLVSLNNVFAHLFIYFLVNESFQKIVYVCNQYQIILYNK